MSIAVAAIQFKPQASVDANLHCAENFLQQAAEAGCQLAVLPENFAYYGQADLLQAGRAESDEQGPVRQFLAEQAARHDMWLVAGTVPVAGPSPRPSARCFLLSPKGEVVDHYDKIHLFDVDLPDGKRIRESDRYAPGKRALMPHTPWGPWGMTVCYDLRFAHLYREYAKAGATLMFVPSAFAVKTGQAHWEPLLRARAIENGCFIVASAQSGRHADGSETYGHAMVIDPWGRVLTDMGNALGAVDLTLDMTQVAKTRAMIPSLDNERDYAHIAGNAASAQAAVRWTLTTPAWTRA